jgi:aminoglycoside 2'-N-acetyltransferase I
MELGPPGDFFCPGATPWLHHHVRSPAEVRVAHTAELGAPGLHGARSLLAEVFGAEFDELDWGHALGGMHALVYEGPRLVAHGSVVQRRLIHNARTLRAGYVEAVAVAADRRRRGYGAAVMDRLELLIDAAYDLGALGATDEGSLLYEARGWRRWRGRTWAMTPAGIVRTEQEDGNIYVREVSVTLDLCGELVCDWREGDLW